MQGDNLPIVGLTEYNIDSKEAKYIQINHIVGKLTANKKATEDHIKKAEFEFMMDLKTLISKTAIEIDPELTRVRNSMLREDRETIPKGYGAVFDKLSIRWDLILVHDQIVIPIDLRRRLLDILHFGLSGITKMTSEAKIFWWPDMKVKDCTACLTSGKNLQHQLLKKISENWKKYPNLSKNTNRFPWKVPQQIFTRWNTNTNSGRKIQQRAHRENLQNVGHERSNKFSNE